MSNSLMFILVDKGQNQFLKFSNHYWSKILVLLTANVSFFDFFLHINFFRHLFICLHEKFSRLFQKTREIPYQLLLMLVNIDKIAFLNFSNHYWSKVLDLFAANFSFFDHLEDIRKCQSTSTSTFQSLNKFIRCFHEF